MLKTQQSFQTHPNPTVAQKVSKLPNKCKKSKGPKQKKILQNGSPQCTCVNHKNIFQVLQPPKNNQIGPKKLKSQKMKNFTERKLFFYMTIP